MQAVLETIRILVGSKKIREGLSSLCFGPLGVLSIMRGAEHLSKIVSFILQRSLQP